ncbi:hypothetical protein SAMN05444410_107168 [Hydrobacter penzbergensis]|uniref:Uncharacterized protein n=1 Tax=Hydrobacter penzbergensis TaxID=1235997 RepID=A0A8X8IGA0_9BACT|nr:hypothetical protein [Hydrobacter penzbergensis]SDW96384.1 hypothetical protein SAMN05444410_107168 [Hydrobacter penzbergensis]
MRREIILATVMITAITAVSAFIAKGQANASDLINDLYIHQFDLTVTGKKASHVNTILLGVKDFLRKFGTPVKVSVEYSEMDEDSMTHYTYKGMEAWYMKDELQAMSITSPGYCFQLMNGGSIKVGNNIGSVAKMFPRSWANKQFAGQVFVSLIGKTGLVDMNFLFEYDVKTNLITGIFVQQ